MSITQQDPDFETPNRSPVRPAAQLDPGSAAKKGEFTFELESHGGYLRKVTGTIAYLDDEAQTYMVLATDGALIRVPIRDIKGAVQSSPSPGERIHAEPAATTFASEA